MAQVALPVQMYGAAFALSPGTLRVRCGYSPGVPYGCYPGTQGYSGYSHSPRQSRSRPWRRGRGRRATTAVRRHWPGRRRPVVHRPGPAGMYTHTHTHTHTCTHAHTRTRTRTRTRTCTHTRTRTQPCLQMHIPTTHVYTHAHTHTHLHCERPLRCRSVRRAELVLHRLLTAPSRRAFGACCARQTSMSISAYMRGRRERERGHFTFTYEDGLEDDAAGRRLGSAAESNPTKSEKSRQGLGRWDHFSGRDLRHCVS